MAQLNRYAKLDKHVVTYDWAALQSQLQHVGANEAEAHALIELLRADGWGGEENTKLLDDDTYLARQVAWYRNRRMC